jgi:hypothetical protein
MIVKTFFLAKIIHRIGAQSLREKKTLHENISYKAGEPHITETRHAESSSYFGTQLRTLFQQAENQPAIPAAAGPASFMAG